jgi:hypothetical protein
MKTTSYDGGPERQALIDIVASWDVADYILQVIPEAPSIAGSSHAKTLMRWVAEYHPVSDGIPYASEALKKDWDAKGPSLPEDTRKGLKEFLEAVSADWKAMAPKAVSKAKEDAVAYFKVAHARGLADRLQSAAESGSLDSFAHAVKGYKVPGKEPRKKPVSVLRDAKRISGALASQDSVLFRFPGALGELIGPIIRGDFLAPLAREKMGKSWIVDYIAKTACFQGCHVLIVDVEMVEDQKLRRVWRQILGAPMVDTEVELPYFDKDGEICHRTRMFKGVSLDEGNIEKQMSAFRRLSGGGCLDVMSVNTGGTALKDVEAMMDDHKEETGREYDVVIVDSLDYLDPEKKSTEGLDKYWEIWKGFRGMGQTRNCAMVSPSHIGRTKGKGSVGEDQVYGSVQKLWTVTKTMLIDATEDEQENGVARVTTRTTRDNKMRKDTVVILQGLDIARPVLDSRWLSDVRGNMVFRGNAGKFGDPLP